MLQLIRAEDVLHTRRLQLEPILPRHAAALFADLQAPELYTFIPHNPPANIQALEHRYRRLAKRQSDTGDELWLNYAVFSPKDVQYMGTVQATMQTSGTTYIAYETFPRYWRQGIAKEACTALITHLLCDYHRSTVTALLDTRNEASWRLLESLGLTRVRTIPNADEFKGSVSHEYEYVLDAARWAPSGGLCAGPSAALG